MSIIKSKRLLVVMIFIGIAVLAKNKSNQNAVATSKHSWIKTSTFKNLPSNAVNDKTRQFSISKQSLVQKLVKSEARALSELNNAPEDTEKKIHMLAQSFDQNQISELEAIAIDESKMIEERISSVYFLKHSGVKAQNALLHIFSNPTIVFDEPALAHSRNEMNQQVEFSLRTMALESIETNIYESGGALHLPELKNNNLPKYLIGLYKMVSVGVQNHDPILKKQLSLSLATENL